MVRNREYRYSRSCAKIHFWPGGTSSGFCITFSVYAKFRAQRGIWTQDLQGPESHTRVLCEGERNEVKRKRSVPEHQGWGGVPPMSAEYMVCHKFLVAFLFNNSDNDSFVLLFV